MGSLRKTDGWRVEYSVLVRVLWVVFGESFLGKRVVG